MASNILLLLDGMPAGGLERQVVEILRGMRDCEQFHMYLGVLQKGGEREKEAVRFAHGVLPLKQGPFFDPTPALSLLKLITKYQIECIHSFGCISDLTAVFAGRLRKIPVINGSIRSAPPRLYRRYRLSRLCMPFATSLVANSHAGLKAFGVDHFSNTRVIYNGVDMDRFTSVPRQVSTGGPAICMVGNFTPKKDQEALVRCLPHILRRYPSARLTLVGKGEKKIRDINRLVEELELNGSVEIVGHTNHPEKYISRSDVCVMLTNYKVHGEGISNAIMEYMAFSKPILATDFGGNGELVINGETGIVIDSHEPHKVATPILKFLDDPVFADRLGSRGKERLEAEFSLGRMILEYQQLYMDLLKGRQ